FLAAEVDPTRIDKRLKTRYLDEVVPSLDQAIDRALDYQRQKLARSVAWPGNAVDLLDALLRRKVTPDLLTDPPSAHDMLNGYVPRGLPYQEALELRARDPDRYLELSMKTVADHVRAMLALQERGAITFDYGNNIRAQAQAAGVANAFDFQGFVPL